VARGTVLPEHPGTVPGPIEEPDMTQVHDPRYTAQPQAPLGHGPYAPPPFPAPGYGAPQGAPFGAPPKKSRTGAIVGSVVAVLVLAGLGIGAFLLFAPRVLDTAEAEREIASLAQEQAGVTLTDVSCPEDVDLAAGTVTTCTASLEGQDVTFTVEQTDDEGNVTIESDQVYVPVTDVEALLTEQFATEADLTVTSSCDAGERTVLVAADGLQLTCTVALTDDPSDTGTVLANVDAQGNVTFDAS
jgi:cytoskeletal protein RodZ